MKTTPVKSSQKSCSSAVSEEGKALVQKGARRMGGVRMEDIARAAGVSRGAVSKVLSPDGPSGIRVGKKVAARIREIAEQMNYLPNLSAQQLAGGKSRLIGVLIDSFGSLVSYSMLQKLERTLAQHGYRLLVGQVHDDVESIGRYLRDFAGRRVEAIVSYAHSYPALKDQIRELYESVQNVIYVGLPKITERDHIYVDVHKGIELLLRHLTEAKYRRIALFLPDWKYPAIHAREDAFRATLRKVGLKVKECPICYYERGQDGVLDSEKIHIGVEKLFRDHPETDVVMASNDLVALHVIQYLHSRGISVPGRVAVTGFDNADFGQAAYPSLTSIDQETDEMAEKLAELLLFRAANPDSQPQSIKISPRLVIRDSTTGRKD